MEQKTRTSGAAFIKSGQHGFTLVELMIVLLVSGLIMAAVVTAYITQQRIYLAQEQVAEMQQNIRAALYIMTRDIRMAGYDRDGAAGAGVALANVNQFGFTKDITDTAGNDDEGDGLLDGPNEDIIYGFDPAEDADNDGVADDFADDGQASLGRDTGGGFQPIAENIHAIEFRYLDEDGNALPFPVGTNDIRSVQISLLAVAGQPDRNFVNNATYTMASGNTLGPFNDNFRRRLLITTIQCRNLGI